MTNNTVTIIEVGPRDGLQNIAQFIPTEVKIQFIQALAASGLKVIEATSFVSPKWVPQLADHIEVLEALDLNDGIRYPVLVPNTQGLEAALKAGAKDIAVFTSASEAFSEKNTNCSIQTSLERIARIMTKAKANKLRTRAYLSCVLGCPYQETVTFNKVTQITQQLFDLGVDEVSLGDTIGTGTPVTTEKLLNQVLAVNPVEKIAMHLHDTYHNAIANLTVALDQGIRRIDSSAGGLGGCPYAPGASGNVATEKVLELLTETDYVCNVDKNKILAAAAIIHNYLKLQSKF
jgi:hydroxymethylglutaryl-CoA lyase